MTSLSQSLIALLSGLGTISIIGWILKYSVYGFDFTDESFYLVWMDKPFIYDYSHTQFGFLYHPLYSILGGDIAALRRVNVLMTFCLAWCMVCTFLNSLLAEASDRRVILHTVASGLATSAFLLFTEWLVTPNYNSLAIQALMVTCTGLLLAKKPLGCKSAAGWMLIGTGGWLAFMAKPSTALALAVGVLIYLLISRKCSTWSILITSASALGPLLLSALLIDGSIWGFIERLRLGFEFARLLESGHTLNQILRIDDFYLGKRGTLAVFLVFFLSLVATRGVFSEKTKWVLVSTMVSVMFFGLIAGLAAGRTDISVGIGSFERMLIFGVVIAAMLTGLMFGKIKILKSIPAPQWCIASLFFAMPHIYAFGTNSNYWDSGGGAGIFWLLAGLTLLGPIARHRASWSFSLPLVLATQAVTATLLQTGLVQPYRQPQPLRLNETNVQIGPRRSSLVLSAGYASYLSHAQIVAQTAGFKLGTPVMDLSGQSPGILYALGAENIGQAWNAGGYPGSVSFAKAGLNRTPCEKIAAAWVLFEPDGPRSISTELMSSLGLPFPDGYELVGTWQTAEGAGGFANSRKQLLYRPIAKEEASETCKALRGEKVE